MLNYKKDFSTKLITTMIELLELDVMPYIGCTEYLTRCQDVERPVSQHNQHFGLQCSH